MDATPIKKPTKSSDDFPLKTTYPPRPAKMIAINMDQMAAKDALLCPPTCALVFAAATAIDTITCTTVKTLGVCNKGSKEY